MSRNFFITEKLLVSIYYYNSTRVRSAVDKVISSAYSITLPSGRPRAMRVTFIPVAL